MLVETQDLLHHDVIRAVPPAAQRLPCRFSSPDQNVPGPCDVLHSDQETSSQAAYSVGTDGTQGWRIAWRTEPEPEAGEPEVRVLPVKGDDVITVGHLHVRLNPEGDVFSLAELLVVLPL